MYSYFYFKNIVKKYIVEKSIRKFIQTDGLKIRRPYTVFCNVSDLFSFFSLFLICTLFFCIRIHASIHAYQLACKIHKPSCIIQEIYLLIFVNSKSYFYLFFNILTSCVVINLKISLENIK